MSNPIVVIGKDLDRQIHRSLAMTKWMIEGQFQHGISPMRFPNLTPERIEELYNVDFDKQFNNHSF